MAGNKNDLISVLRGKLSDDRASATAFSLAVTANAKSALLEIANGFFIVNVEQGERVDSLRFNLSDPRYSTVGKLYDALSHARGYSLKADETMRSDHASDDIVIAGIIDISNGKTATIGHRLWSDQELRAFLQEAASLHNPNYTGVTNIPTNEQPFVVMKAQAAAYRALAADSARRKGLDTDAATLLTLASDLERQYEKDLTRLHRVIPVAKADESKMGVGDVVVGTLVKSSLRAGYVSPHRPAGNQQPPTLLDPADDDIEDTLARLRWSQIREQRFAYVELWRDTQPKVERCISGKLNLAASGGTPAMSAGTQYSKPGTSKQVLGVHSGAYITSPVFDGFFFWTAAELAGASVTMSTFIDGYIPATPAGGTMVALGDPLEPDTDYYYRLYIIDKNGEILPSEVKKVRTRNMRATFKRDEHGALSADAITPKMGPLAGGTSITILGRGFAAGVKVYLNGKEAAVTVDSATQLTVISPAFTNPQWIGRNVDIWLVHPNGLRDIAVQTWTVQA